jgi:hypothetical protein
MAVATIQVPKRVCAYGRDQTHFAKCKISCYISTISFDPVV